MQRYIKDPYLLDGYKFDLRLYVLVTSFQPLEAFIYKDGFGRISTEPFSLHDLSNRLIHLTNSSVQKLSSKGPTSDNPLKTAPHQQAGGSKVSEVSTGMYVSAFFCLILCVHMHVHIHRSVYLTYGVVSKNKVSMTKHCGNQLSP